MDDKSLHRFDLNLIKVFLAIWEAGNLTLAARQLGLTQPAVSHALKRLREDFDDPLFVRTGQRMEPTQLAADLRIAFEQALRLVAGAMRQSHRFDPASATRQFRLALSDTGEFVVLPRLLAAVQTVAPLVTLRSIRVAPADLASALRTGQVDAAIGYHPGLAATGCEGRPLLRDRMVCLFRRGHPLTTRPWDAETFAGLSFLEVGRDATGHAMARQMIADLGIAHQMAAQVDHFTILPEIVRRTDHVALFPASVLAQMNRHGEFDHRELPFVVPQYDVDFWVHHTFTSDPGLNWLFGVLSNALET